MKGLHTVWCHISCEAAGEFWHWSLSGVKGLRYYWNVKSCSGQRTLKMISSWAEHPYLIGNNGIPPPPPCHRGGLILEPTWRRWNECELYSLCFLRWIWQQNEDRLWNRCVCDGLHAVLGNSSAVEWIKLDDKWFLEFSSDSLLCSNV